MPLPKRAWFNYNSEQSRCSGGGPQLLEQTLHLATSLHLDKIHPLALPNPQRQTSPKHSSNTDRSWRRSAWQQAHNSFQGARNCHTSLLHWNSPCLLLRV